ncbi:MAG TPA: hypothetical protein VGX00_08580 [Thermoplasmata archaeon]|nr:hypothetical protein [Thermoplasmata archaeon]
MEIYRNKDVGGREVALQRVGYCLNQLERYGLKSEFAPTTVVGPQLKLEEMIGALVAAEQALLAQEPTE